IKDRDNLKAPALPSWEKAVRLTIEWDNELDRIRRQRQAEADRAALEERTRLAELAKQLDQPELAKTIEETPPEPHIVARGAPMPQGQYYRDNWKWEFSCAGKNCIRPDGKPTVHSKDCPGTDEIMVPAKYRLISETLIGADVRDAKQTTNI